MANHSYATGTIEFPPSVNYPPPRGSGLPPKKPKPRVFYL